MIGIRGASQILINAARALSWASWPLCHGGIRLLSMQRNDSSAGINHSTLRARLTKRCTAAIYRVAEGGIRKHQLLDIGQFQITAANQVNFTERQLIDFPSPKIEPRQCAAVDMYALAIQSRGPC